MLFETFGKTSVNHVPVSSVCSPGLAAVLALIGSFDTLTDYVVFAMWIFYALITGTIFVYRRKYPAHRAAVSRVGLSGCAGGVFAGRRVADLPHDNGLAKAGRDGYRASYLWDCRSIITS